VTTPMQNAVGCLCIAAVDKSWAAPTAIEPAEPILLLFSGGRPLYYLGPGSLENTNPKHAKETKDTAALQTSAKKSQAVHIIRRINKAKKTRPSTGFCYDGLGEVVAQEKLQDN